jgi:hypothetical protein
MKIRYMAYMASQNRRNIKYKDFDKLIWNSIREWDSRIWGLAFKMISRIPFQIWILDLASGMVFWIVILELDSENRL